MRLNAVSPGWIATGNQRQGLGPENQRPAARVGRSADAAERVARLLSAAAGFVTGREWIVDGGMTRCMIHVD